MNKKIWDYFEDDWEYPHDIAHNPIPYGTVWTYVSSTFLNGFINYVKPLKVYLLDRYTTDDGDITDRKASYQEKGDNKWLKFTGTKVALKEKIISGEYTMYHTHLDCFGDDIIILAKIEAEDDKAGRYIFFWYINNIHKFMVLNSILIELKTIFLKIN